MRRMPLVGATLLLGVGAWALFSGPAAAAPARSHQDAVTVTPMSGYAATTFSVSFTAPDRTGVVHGMYRYYSITATGSAGPQNCLSGTGRDVGTTRAPVRVRVNLKPSAQGWCLGTFQGSVTELARPVCPYREVCPQYIVLLRRIGRFTFTVHRAPSGGDTTPPVFAGLTSAVTCTPGPERPGETTPYHLSWDSAQDNVTPSARIVYDVFMSSTPGGEDFSHPSWTTAPGVTAFTTPPLPSADAVYFVVRARDQAGNEDDNTVERPGVDPCV
jgi:hypothetical protein